MEREKNCLFNFNYGVNILTQHDVIGAKCVFKHGHLAGQILFSYVLCLFNIYESKKRL